LDTTGRTAITSGRCGERGVLENLEHVEKIHNPESDLEGDAACPNEVFRYHR